MSPAATARRAAWKGGGQSQMIRLNLKRLCEKRVPMGPARGYFDQRYLALALALALALLG